MAKAKPITVGKGTSYTRPVTPGRSPRPVSAKPSAASKVRAAAKTTSSGITKRPDGRAQTEGRKARQATSTAKVTQSGGGTSGSAKVTTGTGGQAKLKAAQQQGQRLKQAAQARRGARGAMKAMEGTLKAARTARNVAGTLKGLARGGVAAAALQARPAADGTLKAAMKRGDYKPKQGPKPSTTTGAMNKKTFDQAFKAARSSGANQFTWRGKKYTTKMK